MKQPPKTIPVGETTSLGRWVLTFGFIAAFAFTTELLVTDFTPFVASAAPPWAANLLHAAVIGLVLAPSCAIIALRRHRRTADPIPAARTLGDERRRGTDDAAEARQLGLAPRTQALLAIFVLSGVVVACVLIARDVARTSVKETLDEELSSVAVIAATRIDAAQHAALTNPDQCNGPDYQRVVKPLRDMLTAAPTLKFIYTMRSSPEGLRFVVDASLPIDANADGVLDQARLGELYPAPDPAMLASFATGKVTVSPKPKTDKWGTVVSAFAPVRAQDGSIECLVGIDTDAHNYLARLSTINAAALLSLSLGCVASCSIGLAVFGIQRRRQILSSALLASESRFRSLVEGADVIVWEFDIASNAFTYVSPQAAGLGYPISAWYAPGFWSRSLHPDDRAAAEATCKAETDAGRSHRFQYRMLTADGHIVWIEDFVSVERRRPRRGMSTMMLRGVMVNISEQKQAEELARAMLALALRLAKAESVTEAAQAVVQTLNIVVRTASATALSEEPFRAAVLVFGHDGVCRFEAAAGLSDEYKAAVEGHCPWPERAPTAQPIVIDDVFNDESLHAYAALFTREQIASVAFIPLMTERGVVGKIMLYSAHTKGVTRAMVDVVSRVALNAGLAVGRIMATERLEQSERSALLLRDSAQSASRAKSEFLANMSHEIRTPMTAILGYADLIADETTGQASPEQRREYLTTIRRSGEHLLTLINDILDLSKIEARKLDVELRPVNPVHVLTDVGALMQVKAKANDLSLSILYTTEIPETINTDAARLRQILTNLLGNAVKFTEFGGVTIAVSLDRESPSGPTLRFDICDTGIGLSGEQIGRLFQAFAQADTSTTRKFGGTGLGLRISKSLANLLGGNITVASEPGKGSTFTVTIATGPLDGVPMIHPTDAGAAVLPGRDSAPTSPTRSLEGLRVFLAEDGVDNQRLIAVHLRKAGAQVSVFDNGLQCLKALTTDASAAGPLAQPPRCDLVLTDMQMPEMDGYTLARTLRQKGWTGRIVAVTAHAMSDDAQKCLAAGCDAYASKPLDRQKLIDVCGSTAAPPASALVSDTQS